MSIVNNLVDQSAVLFKEAVMSPEDSAEYRKKAAAPTGEADIARSLTRAFLNAGVSKSNNAIESDGVKGEVTIPDPRTGKELTLKALFSYNRDKMAVTIILGDLKKIILSGSKDKNGLFTKFKVGNTQLRASDDAYLYLKG